MKGFCFHFVLPSLPLNTSSRRIQFVVLWSSLTSTGPTVFAVRGQTHHRAPLLLKLATVGAYSFLELGNKSEIYFPGGKVSLVLSMRPGWSWGWGSLQTTATRTECSQPTHNQAKRSAHRHPRWRQGSRPAPVVQHDLEPGAMAAPGFRGRRRGSC